MGCAAVHSRNGIRSRSTSSQWLMTTIGPSAPGSALGHVWRHLPGWPARASEPAMKPRIAVKWGCDTGEPRGNGRRQRVQAMSNPISKWLKMPTLAERLRAQGVRDDLVQAAGRAAFGRQSDRGLPAMSALLTDDEGVIQLVEARYAGATGLLVLTTRRLLFPTSTVDRTSEGVVQLPDVVSVESRKHRGMGVLDVTTTSGRLVADQILGTQAE